MKTLSKNRLVLTPYRRISLLDMISLAIRDFAVLQNMKVAWGQLFQESFKSALRGYSVHRAF